MSFVTLAREVLSILGPEWTPQAHTASGWNSDNDFEPQYLHCDGPDGARLYLNLEKGKIRVSGGHADNKVSCAVGGPSTIRISETKPAAQIAADIKRRLLSDLTSHVAACNARIAEDRAFEALTAKNAAALAAITGTRIGGRSHEEPSIYVPDAGDLRVSGNSIRFERFSVNANEAIAMLAALVKARGK